MPYYGNFSISIYREAEGVEQEEIARFQVESQPLGFRGLWGLSKLLRLLPHITGGKPCFKFRIRRKFQKTGIEFTYLLYRNAYNESKNAYNESKLLTMKRVSVDTIEEVVIDTPISQPSYFSYQLIIQTGLHSESCNIAGFSALVQEHITMAVLGLVGGIIATGCGVLIQSLLGE